MKKKLKIHFDYLSLNYQMVLLQLIQDLVYKKDRYIENTFTRKFFHFGTNKLTVHLSFMVFS